MSKAAALLGAQQRLEVARRGREQPVGAGGGEHDGVDLGGGDAGALSALLAGLAAQHGDGLLGRGDPALPDAGALDDPLVGGVEHPGEVGVGENAGRDRRPDAGDLGERSGDHRPGCGFALGEFGGDVLVEAGSDREQGHANAVLDGVGARGAVADDGDAAHAEQRGAAVRGVVEMRHQLAQRRALEGVRGAVAHQSHEDAGRRLVELENDVAYEAVAHHDIDRHPLLRARQDVAALDVAGVVDSREPA